MNTYFRTGVVTLLLGFSLTACHEAKKSDTSAESTASERKLDFQSDDEFLTYIQKAHFNYMWEGAEPTSGLACERIHTDGVYPENDADIVTTGGSGFGIAGLLVGIERGFITQRKVWPVFIKSLITWRRPIVSMGSGLTGCMDLRVR